MHHYRNLPDGTFEVQSNELYFITPWFLLEDNKGVAKRLPYGKFQIVLFKSKSIMLLSVNEIHKKKIRSYRYLGNVVPASPKLHKMAEDLLKNYSLKEEQHSARGKQ